jgi:hypothetical protein
MSDEQSNLYLNRQISFKNYQNVIFCDLKMCFFPILQLEEGVSSLFSNFGTTWAIFKIQIAKLVRILTGLTIHTCRYTGHTISSSLSIIMLSTSSMYP